MAVNRRHDIPIIILFVLFVVGFGSFRYEDRLRDSMPAEFFDASQFPANQRAAEEKLAQAYWACTVSQIQWKYGYAHRLPNDPPEEFAVTTAAAGPAANDAAARLRYWRRLRLIWDASAIWERHYSISPQVFKQSAESAGQWLQDVMRRISGHS